MTRKIRIWRLLQELFDVYDQPQRASRRQTGYVDQGDWQAERRYAYTPSGLDRIVTGITLAIVLILAAVAVFALQDAPADKVEWLTLGARMLAYDKPL